MASDPPPPYTASAGTTEEGFNSCPNGCESGVLTQGQLESHLQDCPLQLVDCELAGAGCDMRVPRGELSTHMADNIQHHLMKATMFNIQLTKELHHKMEEKDRQIATLQRQFDLLSVQKETDGFVCHEFVLRDFAAHQAKGGSGEWLSRVVTDAIGAVCVQLEIDTNGHKPSANYLTAKLRLANNNTGGYTAFLHVALHMLNQLGDHGHYVDVETLSVDVLSRTPFGVKIARHQKKDNFFLLANLGLNSKENIQYLKNDTLRFKFYLKYDPK